LRKQKDSTYSSASGGTHSLRGATSFIDHVSGSWILIAFKREFPFEDVLRLWEVLWTDYYTNGMVLFVALAVLESHRDVILRYLVEFDEILKVRALSLPRLFVSNPG